ncbi:hypothetical protein A3K86_19705 [Photobacterium jeanii]|uniref:Inositol monophosphatase n=1 Tax=Photobacterium jeanii TaxID=858640 RepID=A0A178K1J1_9GAMM|nr:inositol monophosphatase family protein [Photobacterium jeanii]OAN11188.1 hypothetical protein A3K86_19705 [Photobacterium jeanii]PST90706.1 inositol-1-monophosphatase [Photobacterium jeanii]
MQLTDQEWHHLLLAATVAAKKANAHIQSFDRSCLQVNHKIAGCSQSAQVVTQVDIACQEIILSHLADLTAKYDFAVLSEENADEADTHKHPRLTKDYFWCIDPLDGTLPFIENTPGYAVSIALVSQSGEAVIGVVVDPVTQDCYQALNLSSGSLLLKNDQPWCPQACEPDSVGQGIAFTLVYDRSFECDPAYSYFIDTLWSQLKVLGYSGLEVVNNKGAVMNALTVLEQPHSTYIKLPKARKGGGSLWDFSATSAIFAAGTRLGYPLITCNIYGAALDLNRRDSNYMNHQGVVFSHQITLALSKFMH